MHARVLDMLAKGITKSSAGRTVVSSMHASSVQTVWTEPATPRCIITPCRPVPATSAPGAAGAGGEGGELPDAVVLKMLQREVLLTRAKLHALAYEQAVAERRTRVLKSQLRQVRAQGAASTCMIPCRVLFCGGR